MTKRGEQVRRYADDVARRAEAKTAAGLKAYYDTCRFAKTAGRARDEAAKPSTQRRAARKKAEAKAERQAKQEHRTTVRAVFRFWGGRCSAELVSPVCAGRAVDPHELIPRGAGGKVSVTNSVAICRPCHREVNGRVGGNRLVYEWRGKAEGAEPRADIPGNVWAVWRTNPGAR